VFSFFPCPTRSVPRWASSITKLMKILLFVAIRLPFKLFPPLPKNAIQSIRQQQNACRNYMAMLLTNKLDVKPCRAAGGAGTWGFRSSARFTAANEFTSLGCRKESFASDRGVHRLDEVAEMV